MIHGEKISVIVEIEILAISQAAGEDLEPAAVRIAAQDRAGVWIGKAFAFLRDDVEPAVAHAPVELAIVTAHDAVQVVISIADVIRKSMRQQFPRLGPPVAIGIAEFPNVGQDRRIHRIADGRDAVSDAGRDAVEAFGKQSRCIEQAVFVRIIQRADLSWIREWLEDTLPD